jgi:hypothetical protein
MIGPGTVGRQLQLAQAPQILQQLEPAGLETLVQCPRCAVRSLSPPLNLTVLSRWKLAVNAQLLRQSGSVSLPLALVAVEHFVSVGQCSAAAASRAIVPVASWVCAALFE